MRRRLLDGGRRFGVRRAWGERDLGDDVDGVAAQNGNLLAARDRNEITVLGDREKACQSGSALVTSSASQAWCHVDEPTIPNASKLGADLTESDTASLETVDKLASP